MLGERERRAERIELREPDHYRVLLVDISGHGKTSGLDVTQMSAKGANVFHIHEGRS